MKNMIKYFLVFVFVFVANISFAGQALYVNSEGDPVKWEASSSDPIVLHPESGACGRFTNAQMLSKLETNLEEWTDIATVNVAFDIQAGVVPGVDGCNYTDYLVGVAGLTTAESLANAQDGINSVLFDNDGNIVDLATGTGNRKVVLGFASPAGFSLNAAGTDYAYIIDGQALFNCYCLDDGNGNPEHDDCGSIVFTDDDLDFTMIHEIGHLMDLDHSSINADLITDSDSSNDDYIPAMYPASYNAAMQKTPMKDDIIALSSLYPADSFFSSGSSSSTYCKVTGTLKDYFGDSLRCASVQAIGVDDDSKNVSFVSGSYAIATDNDGDGYTDGTGECASGCGEFTLYLEPGVSYTLQVKSINSAFVGGSSVGPCASAQLADCDSLYDDDDDDVADDSNSDGVPDYIEACNDSSTSTTCTACVYNETLLANDAAANIATKITNECVAGATVALGNITTESIATTSAATETLIKGLVKTDENYLLKNMMATTYNPFATIECPESGGNTDDDTSSSSAACSLGIVANGSAASFFSVWFMFLGVLLSFGINRFKKSNFE